MFLARVSSNYVQFIILHVRIGFNTGTVPGTRCAVFYTKPRPRELHCQAKHVSYRHECTRPEVVQQTVISCKEYLKMH